MTATTATDITLPGGGPAQRLRAMRKPAPTALASRWFEVKRTVGMMRFAIVISIIHILGHAWLGFEGSWLTPFVALATGYLTELVGETARAAAEARPPRYAGGARKLLLFLLPSHIAALAVSMLLFVNEQWWLTVFAVSVAIGSKYLVRIPITGSDGRETWRHVLNPSNMGIITTMLLFPTTTASPAYQVSAATAGWGDWVLPMVVLTLGTLFNAKIIGRLPLVLAWFGFFVAQGVLRAWWHDAPLIVGAMPMTGFAFLLYSFYMVTEPATTPITHRNQVLFSAAAAFGYGVMVEAGVVNALFYTLIVAQVLRAGGLLAHTLWCRAQATADRSAARGVPAHRTAPRGVPAHRTAPRGVPVGAAAVGAP